jgi:hypothetical protein
MKWETIWAIWNVYKWANAYLPDTPENWADKEWLEQKERIDFDLIEERFASEAADLQAMSDLP